MVVVAFAAAFAVLPQATPGHAAAIAASSPGYVLMIHATAEPQRHQAVDAASTGNTGLDQQKAMATNTDGALTATGNDGSIVFRAILYRADTASPAVVRDPRLEIGNVGGGGRLTLSPSLPPDGLCRIESSWAGHEGSPEACTVYRVPATEFDGLDAVTLTLHFTDAAGPQHRVHNAAAHGLLHLAIGGAPIDLRAVDAMLPEPTPLLIRSLPGATAI
jgi:hypothetical protein